VVESVNFLNQSKNQLIHFLQFADLDDLDFEFGKVQALDGVFGYHDLFET